MNIADWKKKVAGKEAKIFLMISLGIFGASAWARVHAKGEGEGRTAEELIRDGDRALAAENWEDAAACYEQFLRDFASAPEAIPLVNRIRYAMVRCYIEKRDFSSALLEIQKTITSFSKEPALQNSQKYRNLLLWKGIAQLETESPREATDTFTDFLRLFPGKEAEQSCEIMLLRAIALIQAKCALEAAKWLKEQSISAVSEDCRKQIYWLQVEAFIAAEDPAAALETLLAESSHFVLIRSQLLAMKLTQTLLQQGKPDLALRSLSIIVPRNEILQRHQLEIEKNRTVLFTRNKDSSLVQKRKSSLLGDFSEFKKIQNWEDSILLLRANAFLESHRYREAALALEALQKPNINEFITALRCWLLIENPQRCLDLIKRWSDQFSESPQLALSRILEGTAYLMLENLEAAIQSFRSIQDGEFLESARVQEIKALLLAHQEDEALQEISKFKSSNSLLQEEVLYLRGVALSNQEEYDTCREAMSDLIRRFPQGERTPDAYFLRASAAHRKMDFSTAITEFREVLHRFPGSKNEAETLVLLGDALLDQKQIAEGLAAYRKIPCSSGSLHEIAIFRLGKVLKKLGKTKELQKEMEHIRNSHPESDRLVEAVREICWIHRENKEPHLALRLYWDILEKQGDNPHASAMELLIEDLQKLYADKAKLEVYQRQIAQIRNRAAKQSTLAARMIWAESRLLKDSAQKTQFISDFLQNGDLQHISPRILCDFADWLWTITNPEPIADLYRAVLKWHPAARERDRALAGLARIAHKNGASEKSLTYWKQLRQQVPESSFIPEAILAESLEFFKSGQKNYNEATSGFQQVLRHDLASRSQKVEALYRLGEIQMNLRHPALAVPYFQRIYIAYGAEKKWVAQAYLQSAIAFEMLGETRSMQRTYQEMIAREDLKGLPEWNEAQLKLKSHEYDPQVDHYEPLGKRSN